MRNWILTIGLALVAGMTAQAAPKPGNHLSGDYVEARTASVFAGACHFNGELTTTGRQAEMVWHVREGAWNGVSLDGLAALAAVASDRNLRDETAPRRSVLYIDARATADQARALAAALAHSYARALGEIVAIKRTPITFARQGEAYQVDAQGAGRLVVDSMPNHECCKQPNLVWYNPLVAISGRRVGYTRESGIHDKTLDAAWSKEGQNTAFYGTFTL